MVLKHAIVVKDATKRYTSNAIVLDGLNLKVPKSCIYGLLGPSGCGKTTLLSCVVGVRKLNEGDIWVLGGRPGAERSGIPGPRVGYMPQEISLSREFSVMNALYFFGRINGLEDYVIEERYLFLKDLLQLPPKNRLVKNMSGGQQRRLSFAAALLHKPELLILDEPTVGLDPVIRDNIWNHLVKLTKEENVTVIITTHYIEEAKQADKIGLMRRGQLLAESSPRELLEQCQTESLEEAFLNLSQLQTLNQHTNINSTANPTVEINDIVSSDSIYDCFISKNHNQLRSNTIKRCKALLHKNILQFVRHPGGVIFSIILPILQMTLFINAVGLDPKGLTISIVNEEAGNCDYGGYLGNVTYSATNKTCDFIDLSCRFVNGINTTVLKKVYYNSSSEAVKRITNDKSVGVMHFNKNFTSGMQDRFINVMSLSEDEILSSEVEVSMHTPDRQIALFVHKKLYDNFFDVYEEIMKECNVTPKLVNVPVKYEDPIYGHKDQTYSSFVTPTFILSLLFVLATSISSSIIITDRHSGVWDRILVQGVTTPEILITHLILQFFVIVIQVSAALCICFLVFDTQCKGSMAIVIWISILSGMCGMMYGLLISVMFTSHTLVNYASVGSFYPIILLCGIIWPIEGMPKFLRWFSMSLPLTIPGISIREVMEKGTSMNEPQVYSGFLIVSAWILALVLLCLYQLRVKTK